MANVWRSLVGALVAVSLLQCIGGAPVSIKTLTKTAANVSVTVHLKNGGPLCTDQAVGSSCLTVYDAVVDSIPISYTSTVKGAKSVTLYACYSKASTFDRPWRKPADNPKMDKQCSIMIAKGLPPTSGATHWTPNEETPTATFFVRAYAMCPGPNGPIACGIGNSKGFFQVTIEPQIPKSLLGAAIGCMFVGPLALAGYVAVAQMRKKSGKH